MSTIWELPALAKSNLGFYSQLISMYKRIHASVFQVALLVVVVIPLASQAETVEFRSITPEIALPKSVVHSWAEYSPVFPLEAYKRPVECEITQVNILQRHGARFPTSGAGTRIVAAVAQLQNASEIYDPRLDFVKSYVYDLGHDDLIGFGAAQSFDAGQEAFERYSHLVSRKLVPFIRSSSSSRVVFSATNWTAGFVKASKGAIIPSAPLVLNEAANDTLDNSLCNNAGDSDAPTTVWQNTFGPAIAHRLNTAVPGANLSDANVPDLISLCAFDTLAKETPSPWCNVFDQGDFDQFEYFGDLDKYYTTGYGQALGPVQGVGYVNELLARLTGKPVSDATQTNTTLDSSPVTFPLDRTFYADFSHDNEMIAIYAALGISRPRAALDPARPDPNRTWLASHLVPFSARLVTEKLMCDGSESVRMLMNDAVVPLEICGAGQDGVCTLDAFVRSQAYARNNGEGDWQKCFS
ncbi:phosphoglycerate mutase-like protein [Ramaria rubella]|nr:phosphoglycerate mutase-like protein [Ramaria rubella]